MEWSSSRRPVMVVRSHRERRTIQAAKLVQLTGDTQREASDGRRPRYVAVPNAGANWFADLEAIGTIDKRVLVGLSRQPGVVDDEQVRRFAAAVGRNFSRFPFPDEVSDQLKPLVDDVRRKYGSGRSPLGQVLQQVIELRLEAYPRWDDPNAVITLVVICNPGVLPTFDAPPGLPTRLDQWLNRDAAGVSNRSASAIAERHSRLRQAQRNPGTFGTSWDVFGRIAALKSIRDMELGNRTSSTLRCYQPTNSPLTACAAAKSLM
jgi:hypothetical protein